MISVLASYRSPKTVIRESPIGGRGLFAGDRLLRGEIVSIKAGHLLTGDELQQNADVVRDAELQIAENLYVAPLNEDEFESVMMFLNHSCDPNVGVQGQIVFVAMRGIESGEELTLDYATINDNDRTMICRCDSQHCRELITGQDWRQEALQEKYGEYFAWHLKEKMKKLQTFSLSLVVGVLSLLSSFSTVQSSPAKSQTNSVKNADLKLANPQTGPTPTPAKKPYARTVKESVEPPFSSYANKNAPVRISRFEASPIIDGHLEDAIWKTAPVFGDFLQVTPGDNIAPVALTEVVIGYDQKNLYLAFRVRQDKATIRATLARRDQISNDDYVGVYLDTFNDNRQAYIFFFNPLGVQADGIFSEGRDEDYSVDLVLESKGVLTEDGYTIEAAIPFKSLRYEAGKDKKWGIHIFRRVKYNNNELDSWMPNDRSRSGTLNQAGRITGLEDISTTRQLEINPTISVSQSRTRVRTIPVAVLRANPTLLDNGRFVNTGLEANLGFTAKLGLTPTITLDFAYNPDFAHVEADAPVVTANQRFPIFFPEKRPFFLERIEIFQTRMNIVNTRAIVDPDLAIKLTGRRGRNTFGVLYASDKFPGFTRFTDDERTDPTLRRGIERFLGKNADIGILRFKREIGIQNNIGFFATTYNFIERHNDTAGFDGRFRLSPKTIFEFQLTGTTSRRFFYDPSLDRNVYRTGNGFGYSYLIERSDRNFFISLNGVGRTRDYRADTGFTPRTNTNQHRLFSQYQTDRDAKRKIIFKRIRNNSIVNFDWRGRMQDWFSNTQGTLGMQRQTFIGGGIIVGHERVFEEEFGAKRGAGIQGAFFGNDPERSAHYRISYAFIETNPNKRFFANVTVNYTLGRLDYDLGAGPKFPRVSPAALLDPNNPLDPGAGKQLDIASTFRYQPTAAFQTELLYTKTRLVRNDTRRAAFDDNIFSSRSTYQFSRNTYLRMRLDYSTLNTRFRPQLIFGWTPNPGTSIYAGYNDDLSYNGYNQFTGQFETGFRGIGRTFFIKASYLFRKSF